MQNLRIGLPLARVGRRPAVVVAEVIVEQEAVMVATDPRFADSGYANPEVLVSTDWVAEHLDDPNVRIVESDEDVLLYDMGHIPGAIKLDWHTDLQNQVERDFLDKAGFEALMRQATASATTRRSSSTATATTGTPPTPTGSSSTSGTATRG